MQKIGKDPVYRANVSLGLRRFLDSLTPLQREERGRVTSGHSLASRRKQSRSLRRWWARAKRNGKTPRHISGNNGRNWTKNRREWVEVTKAPFSDGKVYCRSSWEKRYILALEQDPSVKFYLVEPFRIPVAGLSKLKGYEPDVLVIRTGDRLELVEIKPKSLLKYPDVKRKLRAARAFCGQMNMKFVTVSYND
jgi:hypothetical protein